jgi:hypothetical protein
MSKIGLHFIRKRLRAMGLDCFGAIERGDLHALSVENLFPALTKGAATKSSGHGLCEDGKRSGGDDLIF